MPLVVEPCSNQAIVELCSDHPCRALLQGPLSFAPAGTVKAYSSALGCRALFQLSDLRALLRSSLCSIAPGPLSFAPAGTVGPCSCALGYRALLQPSDHRALHRSSLSSLAPEAVELCSGRHCRRRALLQRPWLSGLAPTKRSEHYSDHPCRALLQEPLSPAPAGTVEPCSCALSCRALLQLSDRRAPL